MTRVDLLSSPAVPTPAAFGIVRPCVMLPVEAGSWPEERLRVVLAHELSHLRRRDPLTQLVAEVVRSIHWFNPLSWHAADRLMHERERACDDEVVHAGNRAVDYADHLVSIASSRVGVQALPRSALTMARVTGFESRVAALLQPAVRRGRITCSQRLGLAVHSLAIVSVLALTTGIGAAPAGVGKPVTETPPLRHDEIPSERQPEARFSVAHAADARHDPADRKQVQEPASSTRDMANARREPVDRKQVEEPASSGRETVGRVLGSVSAKTSDPLADPLSERIERTGGRAGWPPEDEIRASKERVQIERLRAAARHEKLFEHDLVRERAEWALSRVRDGEIVAPLVQSLEDGDWRVQAYAAWALCTIGATQASPAIARLLDHPNWRVRAQASSSLLQLGTELSNQVLARLAHDPAWQVRINVVEFLRRRSGRDARDLLSKMLDDPHSGTRMEVEAALSELDAH